MKKSRSIFILFCILFLFSIHQVKASSFKSSYQLFETKEITIDKNKEVRKQEETKKEKAVYIAIGVSVVSFIVFIESICILIRMKKGQKK